MFFRTSGWIIVLFWAASMTWLVRHDVWPALTAGEAPQVGPSGWAKLHDTHFQVGIFNKYDQRIGTAWTVYNPRSQTREDTIHLHWAVLPGPMLLKIESGFMADGKLDNFKLTVDGAQLGPAAFGANSPIVIEGERYASVYAFRIRAGRSIDKTFKIGAMEAGLIGDVFRPFAALPDLEVGRTWRMQVVNPISTITGVGQPVVSMLVRVTGRETITTVDRQQVGCFVVEAPNVRAWVDDSGLVWVQQMNLPLGGKITARNEPYDEKTRNASVARFETKRKRGIG